MILRKKKTSFPLDYHTCTYLWDWVCVNTCNYCCEKLLDFNYIYNMREGQNSQTRHKDNCLDMDCESIMFFTVQRPIKVEDIRPNNVEPSCVVARMTSNYYIKYSLSSWSWEITLSTCGDESFSYWYFYQNNRQ